MLRKWAESICLQWAAGAFQATTAEETQSANAQAIGQVKILQELLDIDYDKLKEVLEDDE